MAVVLKLVLIVAVYGAVTFAVSFGFYMADRTAESLARYMTAGRLGRFAAVSALVVGALVVALNAAGWLRLGDAPYASPGFDEALPEVSEAVEPAGPAPKVDAKVRRGGMDEEGDAHRERLERFEGASP